MTVLATTRPRLTATALTVEIPSGAAWAFYIGVAVFAAAVAVAHLSAPGLGFAGHLALIVQAVLCVWMFRSFGATHGFLHPAAFHGLFTMLLLARELPLYVGTSLQHDAIRPGSGGRVAGVVSEYVVLAAIGIAAYAAVFVVLRARGVFDARAEGSSSPALPDRAARATAAALVFAAVVMADLILRKGGLQDFLLGWGLGRRAFLAGSFYIVPVVHLPALGTVIWGMKRESWRRPAFWLAIAATLPLLFLATGGRAELLAYGFMLFAAYCIGRRRVAVGAGAALAGAAFVVFAAVGDFRSSLFSQDRIDWTWSTDDMVSGFRDEFVARANTRSGALPIIAYVPWSEHRLHGQSLVAVATLPVPRTLWSDKPGLIDGRVGQTFFGINVGIPAGTVGEAFWNFGWVGVLFGFAALALVHAALYQFAVVHASAGAAAIYLAALWTLRFPGTSALTTLLLWVVPAMIMARAAGGRQRPRVTAMEPEPA